MKLVRISKGGVWLSFASGARLAFNWRGISYMPVEGRMTVIGIVPMSFSRIQTQPALAGFSWVFPNKIRRIVNGAWKG